MVVRSDYTADAVIAARSVLIELSHLLGEYRDSIVVIGGWVPALILPQDGVPHVGSMDIDLALNHLGLRDIGYKSIRELLLSRGYYQGEGTQPFIFYRNVPVKGRTFKVEVDLLAGEYEGTGRGRRTQKLQDGIRARKARGCDLAFGMFKEVTVRGVLPGGGQDAVTVRVASVVPFLAMKGMALYDRLKEKDAWDIYYCLRIYGSNLDALVEEFLPHIQHGLAREGLLKIAGKFSSPEDMGPRFVADFEEVRDPEERAFLQRDAYERVNYLLKGLGII